MPQEKLEEAFTIADVRRITAELRERNPPPSDGIYRIHIGCGGAVVEGQCLNCAARDLVDAELREGSR